MNQADLEQSDKKTTAEPETQQEELASETTAHGQVIDGEGATATQENTAESEPDAPAGDLPGDGTAELEAETVAAPESPVGEEVSPAANQSPVPAEAQGEPKEEEEVEAAKSSEVPVEKSLGAESRSETVAPLSASAEPVEAQKTEDAEPGDDSGSASVVPAVSFSSLDLDERVLKALRKIEFTECTPIQAQTLPHTLTGRDLIGQAQTGTGKTAAFLLTILNRFCRHPIALEDRYASEPRALVVAPTRELALQIEKDAKQLSRGMSLNIISVIGGTALDKARARLRDEAIDLLIATPGRLLDHLTSRDVYLEGVEILVLDEADRMLDMGFIPDVKRIVRATPRRRQTLLFSATFNADIINLAKRWTDDPVEVMLAVDHVPAKTVEQRIYMVESHLKLKILCNLLADSEARRVIVFCNRRDETRRLSEALEKRRIPASMISGELAQAKRLKTLEQFRKGVYRVLVATDVAGRGLHIEGVTHVVNYNLPDDPEDYVHRIGRTGRAGETGVSISFACEDDAFLIPDLEAYLGQKLELTQPEPELLA